MPRRADTSALVRAEGKAHPVTLSTFDLDRTEVTVADYARCVSAGACAPADLLADDPRFSRPDFPVTHVRWDDAVSLLRAGPADGCRPRPSGSTPRAASTGASSRGATSTTRTSPTTARGPPIRTDATDGFVGLAPVGSFPDGATPLGLLDMAGNAAEWVADVLEVDVHGHPVGYADERGDRPSAEDRAAPAGFHVVRGGSYEDGAMWLRSAARDYDAPAPAPARRLPLRGERPMRIAHFSDLHLLVARGRARRGASSTSASPAGSTCASSAAASTAPPTSAPSRGRSRGSTSDHVVVTGDLTNLALESEFELARDLFERELGLDPSRVTIVPGNHDLYTRGALASRRFERYLGAVPGERSARARRRRRRARVSPS